MEGSLSLTVCTSHLPFSEELTDVSSFHLGTWREELPSVLHQCTGCTCTCKMYIHVYVTCIHASVP